MYFFFNRKRFPISVNCWFCNSNTRVPFNNRDSFNCPTCRQYNGFTSDGDYNKEISEQHYSKLNTSNNVYCQRTDTRLHSMHSVNGLCEGCNRNQEMKIIQLANFKPRSETTYDEEIEEYRQRLEDSYQLCQQCQRHLNKTLNRVKTKLIGSKISQLVSKGNQILGASKSLKKDRQLLSKFAMLVVLVLSIVNLAMETNMNLEFLRSFCNQTVMNFYFHIVALRLTILELLKNWMKYMGYQVLMDVQADAVATSAVALNSIILVTQKQVRVQIIVSMLLWSLKMMLTEFPINPAYLLAVKGSIAGVLVLVTLHMIVKSKKVKETVSDQNSSFHKIHSEIFDDSDNEVDTSNSSSFNFDTRSIISSGYSPSTQFNSCLRDRTLLQPAKTIPFMDALNSSHRNSSLRNSTFGRGNETVVQAASVCTMDLLSNRSFSIRQEVAAADRSQVQSDINKLNISGNYFGSTSTLKDFGPNKSLNPFSLENSRCGSPTPSIASVFSGSHRAQVISPPRLEPSYMGESNTSWVAGGYWSSPQKRFLEANHVTQIPEMSRSSSQSSGLGTIDSGKNSRENSIGYDDATSIFSEPVRRHHLFEKPADNRSLYGQSFTQAPRVNNFFLSSNVGNNNFRKYRETNSFFK